MKVNNYTLKKVFFATGGSGGYKNDEIGVYNSKIAAINSSLSSSFSKLNTAINAEGVTQMVNAAKDEWISPVAVEFFNQGGEFFSDGVKQSFDKQTSELVNNLKTYIGKVNDYVSQRAANQGITSSDINTGAINIDSVDVSSINAGDGQDVYMKVGTASNLSSIAETMKSNISSAMDSIINLFDSNQILTGNNDWDNIMSSLNEAKATFNSYMTTLIESINTAVNSYEQQINS